MTINYLNKYLQIIIFDKMSLPCLNLLLKESPCIPTVFIQFIFTTIIMILL